MGTSVGNTIDDSVGSGAGTSVGAVVGGSVGSGVGIAVATAVGGSTGRGAGTFAGTGVDDSMGSLVDTAVGSSADTVIGEAMGSSTTTVFCSGRCTPESVEQPSKKTVTTRVAENIRNTWFILGIGSRIPNIWLLDASGFNRSVTRASQPLHEPVAKSPT